MRYLIVLVVMMSCLSGCDNQRPRTAQPIDEKHSVEVSIRRLFFDPVEPHFYELPSQALSRWREYKNIKPTLVILADQPYLAEIPSVLRSEVVDLVENSTVDELIRRSDFDQPDPLVLAPQAVSAALLSGLFSEVVWLLPDPRKVDEFSWDVMDQQLRDYGLLAEGESAELVGQAGVGRVMLAGIPLRIIHPDVWNNVELPQPVLLHVDLSYFKSVYHNEVRTSSYKILKTVARMLRSKQMDVLDVSFSFSNADRYVGLDGRFTLHALAELLRHPEMIDTKNPEKWKIHATALYQQSMYRESEVTTLYEKMVEMSPDDPTALYGLSQRYFYNKDFARGLKLVDRAVEKDGGYVVAYLELAEKARGAGDLQNAELLLTKAQKVKPDSPEILLRKAEVLQGLGRVIESQAVLKQLSQMSWSKVYHPELPDLIKRMQGAEVLGGRGK